MSERRQMVQREHSLPVTRRCELLEVARSTAYYRPSPVSEADLALMRLSDELHLERPFYGSPRRRDELATRGHWVNRKRVQRLMRQMGLAALYAKPRTSVAGRGHKVYPYVLRDISVARANPVWATDICYIPMARGFMYLVAVMDWYSDTATYSHAFKVTEYPWNNPPVNTRSSCPYANQPEAGAVRRRQGVRPWHLARRPQQVRQRDP